jgi:hypothetical protein
MNLNVHCVLNQPSEIEFFHRHIPKYPLLGHHDRVNLMCILYIVSCMDISVGPVISARCSLFLVITVLLVPFRLKLCHMATVVFLVKEMVAALAARPPARPY